MPPNMTKIIESECDKFDEFRHNMPVGAKNYEGYWHDITPALKTFLRLALTRTLQAAVIETVGNIGAKLLARHSPQAVLDAYFDAANEELESNQDKDEANN